MCGIAGIVGEHGTCSIAGMVAGLAHRGPDASGSCSRGPLHVGATRLSIIDPAAGAQPIFDEAGERCVVFNGEIYNHRELRAELRARGHVFATGTDSEVIVHLYEEHGRDFARHLRGMFAVAVLDGTELVLARDRMGIKPLFHAAPPRTGTFLFASEIKPIVARPEYTPRLDRQALADCLVLSYAPGDRTLFAGIRSLPAGHTMRVSLVGGRAVAEDPVPYCARNFERDPEMALEDAQRLFEAALRDAVETHLVADVDVGLTLSGGIDSTMLGLLANEASDRPLMTFAAADDPEHPDLVQARRMARLIGAEHHEHLIGFDDYLAAIPQVIAAEERPSSLYGLPFHLLSREISRHVKCALHGEGADELLGGYPEYLDRERRLRFYRTRLPILKHLGIPPSDEAVHTMERLASASTFPQYLDRIFEVNLGEPLRWHHLDLVDRYSMAFGVEMRVPYVDDRLVACAGRIPTRHLVRHDLGIRKYLLRRFALRRFGDDVVDVVLREKLGAPSSGVHLLERFDALCERALPDSYVNSHPLGRVLPTKRQLLLFDVFEEIFMQHRGDHRAVGRVEDFISRRAERPPETETAELAGAR